MKGDKETVGVKKKDKKRVGCQENKEKRESGGYGGELGGRDEREIK